MAWTTEVITHPKMRYLIVTCDTEEEKEALKEKAICKGWEFYQEGTEPKSRRIGIWLKKLAPDVTFSEEIEDE